MRIGADRTVIWDNPQNSLGLFAILVIGVIGLCGGDAGRGCVWYRGLSIRCPARLLRVLGERRNIVQTQRRCSSGLFWRARWFLSLNRRRCQSPGQRYRHAKRSNRFQIFPPFAFSRSALSAVLFKQFLPVTQTWIVGLRVWMHPSGRKRVMQNPTWKALVGCFLLLFLQVAGVSPLQIAVNIWPKLLQLIPEGVDAHLRSPG
jgi:hypothetical protein